jgi:hypothetical protein
MLLCLQESSTLEFQVLLNDPVMDGNLNNGIYIYIYIYITMYNMTMQESEWKKAKEGDTVKITYSAALEGDANTHETRAFKKVEDLSFVIGQANSPICDGLERAIMEVVKQQSAFVTVSSCVPMLTSQCVLLQSCAFICIFVCTHMYQRNASSTVSLIHIFIFR